MNVRELLTQLGLQGKEIDLFLTGSMLGTQPASILADKLGLNRITSYITLKRMVEKRLASSHIKNGMHVFTMASPEQIIHLARRREHTWRDLQEHIPGLLSKFVLETPTKKMDLKIFQGMDHILPYLESLRSAEHIVWIEGESDKPVSYTSLCQSLSVSQHMHVPMSLDIIIWNHEYSLIILFYEKCHYALAITSKHFATEWRSMFIDQIGTPVGEIQSAQTGPSTDQYPTPRTLDRRGDLVHHQD